MVLVLCTSSGGFFIFVRGFTKISLKVFKL